MADYSGIDRPFNNLLSRDGSEPSNPTVNVNQSGGASLTSATSQRFGGDGKSQQTSGGSVERVPVRSDGALDDVWIKNTIRSLNWKPKSGGFYMDGTTGYAEFANVYISGKINALSGVIGGFEIGPTYIRDTANTMGLSSVVGASEVRFWAGSTYDDRATAPFRVVDDGSVFADNITITGGSIDAATIVHLSGTSDPVTAPDFVGQMYFNTVGERVFVAIKTTDPTDWLLLSTTRLPRYVDVNDVVSVTDSLESTFVCELQVYDDCTIAEDIVAEVIT